MRVVDDHISNNLPVPTSKIVNIVFDVTRKLSVVYLKKLVSKIILFVLPRLKLNIFKKRGVN